MAHQRVSRPRAANIATIGWIAALLALIAAFQSSVTAGDLALPDGWEAHPAFVLRPEGDRYAYFEAAGFSEDGDTLFVAQRRPYRWRVWNIHDHRFVSEADDGRTDAFLSSSPCIGLATRPPPVDRFAHNLITFRCDNAGVLQAIEVDDGAVLGWPVKIIQASPCRLALLQFTIGTAVVDLDRGELRPNLMDLFPKANAIIASSTGCIAYALVNPRDHGPSNAYRIDLQKRTRQWLMRFPQIGNLYNPLFNGAFEVSPNGNRALLSVMRSEINRKATFGGTVRLELVDLKHRKWVRSLAESETLIRGASWLDNVHIIYVVSDHHITILDAETGAQREIHLPDELVAANGGTLHFIVSSDKRRLMFQNLRAIYVYDLPDLSGHRSN